MEKEGYDYEQNLIYAKRNTVYRHAMVWIKDALENKKTDSERFEEIQRIVNESAKQL